MRYRLTIATRRAATTFCIRAATKADASRKAALIAAGLNRSGAKIHLTTHELCAGDLPLPMFAEARISSYWGA